MSKKLVLIDGHSILNRAFYGLPDLTNAKGRHTGAVYGFLNILFKILDEEKPDFLAVAFDAHAKTFRHLIFEEYKGTRKGMPEELREQVPLIKEMLSAMEVEMLEQEGLEADDILGTLAKKAEAEGIDVSLVSGDRDLLQIASDHIKIRIPKTKMGRTQIEDYYARDVLEALQVTPTQFIELKALMGDTADNIPGVPKIGQKTATELIVTYGSIDNIYAHLEEISKKSVRETLAANRELADLSKVLATIKTDCELCLDYEKAKAEGFFTARAYALCKELEFQNLLTKFEDGVGQAVAQKDALQFETLATLSELEELLGEWEGGQEEVGLDILMSSGEIAALAVSCESGGTRYYAVKGGKQAEPDGQLFLFGSEDGEQSRIAELLRRFSQHTPLALFDGKEKLAVLSEEGVEHYFDTLIAAYLINPLKSDYAPESIAMEHLGAMFPGRQELFGKKSIGEMLETEPEQVSQYLANCAYTARLAAPVLREKLEEMGMSRLMTEVEMPLSLVLFDMEREGVLVRRDELKAYGDALVGRIRELEDSIHELAGRKFNILSPKQLGEVLFEELKLPGGKKTKTGYSTAADVLEKLAPEEEIVREILEYRGLTKLKSTYADGLADYIREDGRIHTHFNQTITATGRISSTEPNLQNIPMRTELGRRIRKVFVPGEGNVFLDADYSQVELRILAHMSGDEQLIEAYHSHADIHRITASKVFHTPFEEVTELQRRNAKAVNFGIVYGISSFGLSQDLSITPKEAAKYIQQYFETYPGIKTFLDEAVSRAKEKGYSTTMFGRRRPIPELASSNFMQRSFGERIAMNSPIQGTAADIMKIAMVDVWRCLKEAGLKSRLILQVHDELILEVPKEERDAASKILKQCMERAADLAVALEVEVHVGSDWYEAK